MSQVAGACTGTQASRIRLRHATRWQHRTLDIDAGDENQALRTFDNLVAVVPALNDPQGPSGQRMASRLSTI